MRKKDLKIGEIYADNYGRAALLVHDGVWSRQRHGTKWFLHPSHAKQERGRAFMTSDKGVLAVHGPVEDLRQIKIPDIHVFEKTRNGIWESFTQALHDFEDTLPQDCYLRVDFTRGWKGLYEEVEAQETAAFEDRERRRAEAYKIADRRKLRAKNIRTVLLQRGMQVQGYTNQSLGDADLLVSGINGVTLSLSDVEELLELDADDLLDPGE